MNEDARRIRLAADVLTEKPSTLRGRIERHEYGSPTVERMARLLRAAAPHFPAELRQVTNYWWGTETEKFPTTTLRSWRVRGWIDVETVSPVVMRVELSERGRAAVAHIGRKR